ncbi:hypothetical protein [Lacticaseibacillus nasuensis]|uniref:hypothetical protein n=1 Tax=Lacticaseibacillus nasuensis TaxID=944671 RepID=UPI002246B3D3|nr:hypothetical protein [Lacticaseibacillus nasuensis]MCX2456003.1 hypothetical protein [Lacticaseibacillus nasuensis]
MLGLNIAVFILTTGLVVTTVARLPQPVNLVVAGLITLFLFVVNQRLDGPTGFTIGLLVWSLALTAGLGGYRWSRRAQRRRRHPRH